MGAKETDMLHYEYKTQGTCSQLITLDIDGGVVHNVVFYGGCSGNLKAISILVEGMKAEEVAEKLSGVRCGMRSTSCAHQLTKAVLAAAEEEKRAAQN